MDKKFWIKSEIFLYLVEIFSILYIQTSS